MLHAEQVWVCSVFAASVALAASRGQLVAEAARVLVAQLVLIRRRVQVGGCAAGGGRAVRGVRLGFCLQ